ncbi:MAG: hypothetical protein QXP44_03155, partial [Candidatus Bathyarchaeia archaeon]
SIGKGLGIRFLKHIERTSCLFFIIDGEDFQYEKQLEILLNEISDYDPQQVNKPFLVSISKIDLPVVKDKVNDFLKNLPINIKLKNNTNFLVENIIPFSSFSKEGLDELLKNISKLIDDSKLENIR